MRERLARLRDLNVALAASGPLAGLEVLDLSWGIAGPMTSMLLADSGADVLRIEAPHDPVRDPVAYRVWNRGKRSANLDLRRDVDREAFFGLAATADVVLESYAPGVAARLGIDEPSLRALNPGLVYCSIPGYRPNTPDADRPAYDALVAARAGLHWDQRGWPGTSPGRISGGAIPYEELEVPDLPANRFDLDGPTFPRSTWPSLGATFLATVGISAALRAREITGLGDYVQTSLLQGAMACAGPTWQRVEHPDAPGYWMWVTDRRAPEGLFECADGRWVHFWTIRPTLVLQAAEADALVIDGSPDSMRDPSNVRIGMDAEDLVVLFHYHPLLAEAFKKFPSDQWVAFGAARGLGMALVRSPEEALTDGALIADGCVVEMDDPEIGPIRHAGLLLEFSRSPGAVRGPAPMPGEHTEEVLRPSASPRATMPRPHRGAMRGPLQGIKVLDLGLGVAGPWGGRVLADLGADVIKVHAPHDGYWTRTHMGLATNWGKRSIALNLKDPRGREVLERLLADADVLVHNMREGAAERLGIAYEDLAEQHPRLVYCHTRGFEHGPRSMQPGTDQTANALAGVEYEDGAVRLGQPPFWSRVNTGDTGNGYLWSVAVVQALYERELSGRGQRVGTSILNACLLNSSYAYCRPDGRAVDRPHLDAELRGLSALYRLYKTRDEWACIAAVDEESWTALCCALDAPDLLEDPRFGSVESRALNDTELSAALEPLFATFASEDLVAAAEKFDLPCEIASRDYPVRLFDDADLAHLITTAVVPGVGRIEQPGVLVEFAMNGAGSVLPPCLAGQHTTEILTELDYDPTTITGLVADGVAVEMRSPT
jgi:crotonobetainyl-CoA:carnitine CoA-transferase CaiB-like acyl-CoA transferase